MLFGRPRRLSATEKLLDLRSQVGSLVVDQAVPAVAGAATSTVAGAATASTELLGRVAALLPVLAQYGELVSGVLRWARNRGTEVVEAVPVPRRRRSRWKSRLRRYAIAGAALGAGYAVYRLTRGRSR